MENFKKYRWACLCASLLLINLTSVKAASKQPIDYVNPFIGTSGVSNNFPHAVYPFGMVQLGPVTDEHLSGGYKYGHESIIGFVHTQLSGGGCGDYGDLIFMPTVGKLQMEPGSPEHPETGYRSAFVHEKEMANPGYYAVQLADGNIHAELTVAPRSGMHRYTFPKTDSANIIIDLKFAQVGTSCAELPADTVRDANLKIVSDTEIEGWRITDGWARGQRIYFVAKFEKPFLKCGISTNDKIAFGLIDANGRDLKAFVTYATQENEKIIVKVGISTNSIEGARKNLENDIPHWDFDIVKTAAHKEWGEKLNKITIDGGDDATKTIFYTALYHTHIHPSINSDIDGAYLGMDQKTYKVENRISYTVFPFWDTYRGVYPLLGFLEPKLVNDVVNTLLDGYQETGILPVFKLGSSETFCMAGYHSMPVVLEAWKKGIRNYDQHKLLKAMVASSNTNRQFGDQYRKFGYIPSDYDVQNTLNALKDKTCPNYWMFYNVETVSRTLENSYDDWCISQMAKELGDNEISQEYAKRGDYFKNLFDAETGFIRPKLMNGQWKEGFEPRSSKGADGIEDFCEGTGWMYLWNPVQDIDFFIDKLGGKEKYCAKLDALFNQKSEIVNKRVSVETSETYVGLIGQYNHGNEPCHHIPYLYNYGGQPWKTQEMVRRIMETKYNTTVDGYFGNEDTGAMSAWYVFSAMGFFPVCVGSGKYELGSPIFKKVSLSMGNGKQFTIEATNVSKENKYIQSILVNGKPWHKTYLNVEDILNGATVKLEMAAEPSRSSNF